MLRQARGIYVAARHAPTAAHTLAQVAKRVPEAVFCLLTALRFHEPDDPVPGRGLDRAAREGAPAAARLSRACGSRASRGRR